MTDRELKRLSRAELLELLIEQVKENESLQAQVERLNARLKDRDIAVQEAGSLAEAALRLNGVFAAADDAVKQYVTNRMQETDAYCTQLEEETREYCTQAARLAQQRNGYEVSFEDYLASEWKEDEPDGGETP